MDGRSDLYSFGVVLCGMLSGEPPFESQTPEGYLGQHLNSPPPPLDKARLPGRTGPALAAIVLRALEKNRDRRFSSAREFAAALERVDPAVTEALLQTAPRDAKTGRNRALSVLLLFVLVAGAVAAALYILNRPGAPVPIPAAVPTSSASVEPAAAPTAGPDDVVIAPRIVEQRTPTSAAAPSPVPPTLLPVTRVVPTRAPAPAPPPADDAAAAETPDEPIEGGMTAARFRGLLEQWTRRPIARRAHRAIEIANAANFWTATHPDDPFSPELKARLPRLLKSDTETALAAGQPALARLFWRAYRELRFSSPDPDLAARVRGLS